MLRAIRGSGQTPSFSYELGIMVMDHIFPASFMQGMVLV